MQPVSVGETLLRHLGSRIANREMMSYAVQALYPGLLATADVAVGAGFLYLRGLSPVGLLMTLLGVVVICHALYNVASQAELAVHRVASGSEGGDHRPSS